MENALNEKELRYRVMRIDRLKAMPQVALKLVDMLGDERTTVGQLEKVIESDPALASKILSLANSAFYGLTEKATTIGRAIVAIGFQELQILALGIGLHENFDNTKNLSSFDVESFWRHSLAVSWVARELADVCGHINDAEAMVSGLLHDIGKLLLATYLYEEYDRILRLAAQGMPYHQAEERMNMDHARVGFWLAERWKLPEMHVSTIKNHHHPQKSDIYYENTACVFLSDLIVKKLNIGLVQESTQGSLKSVMETTRFEPDHIQEVYKSTKKRLPDILDQWIQIFS